MIAIVFSRPLTLTISCFAITSLLQELMEHRAAPASRWARRRCAQINVGICGMAPGMMAHNSLSNTKLVVTPALALTGSKFTYALDLSGTYRRANSAEYSHKAPQNAKTLGAICVFWWDRTSVKTRR